MPRTLSLCVIAKNEEAMLSGCLESVAGAVDEIVVVDTGSTDRTVEVALAHGARVLDFPWRHDFSAARNAALEVATSEWVFFLDADERLDPASMGVLRRLVEAEPADAPPTIYAPLILNVDAAGASLGADHMPRLWRARPELRFRGRIHEQVGVGVAGLRTAIEDALKVVHLGYDPVHAHNTGKHQRNIALLDLELAERPDDPGLIFYRAKEAYALGDDAAAAEAFQRVIREAPGLNFALSAYVFGVECLRSTGRSSEALSLAMNGVRANPQYSELWYAAGMAALDIGRPVQAEGLFREAMKPSEGFALTAFSDPDIRAWRAELAVGQALRVQNLPADALKVWVKVRDRVPLGPERVRLDLDMIDAYLGLGQQQEAWALLEPMLDTAPGEAVGALLEFFELYVQFLGPADAWKFFTDTATVHPAMLRELAIVSAGIELAELLDLVDPLYELLQIAVHLGTQVPRHYETLARVLSARGEEAAAEAARRAARRVMAD
jgi:tetratricopeptide (TPR) repeat protein